MTFNRQRWADSVYSKFSSPPATWFHLWGHQPTNLGVHRVYWSLHASNEENQWAEILWKYDDNDDYHFD